LQRCCCYRRSGSAHAGIQIDKQREIGQLRPIRRG
jgi:hypothetical protein